MKNVRPIDLTFGSVFVCLMTIGSNIAVWFPMLAVPIGGASVPLSLQTFFAILAGFTLGKRLGTISILTYILVGLCGVPVFAGMKAGPFPFISPTGGFILSFIVVAFVVGLLAEYSSRPSILWYFFTAIIGVCLNYGIGVTYMYIGMNTWIQTDIPYAAAWASMLPFLIKDTVLGLLSGAFIINLAKRVPQRWIHVLSQV